MKVNKCVFYHSVYSKKQKQKHFLSNGGERLGGLVKLWKSLPLSHSFDFLRSKDYLKVPSFFFFVNDI